MTFAWSAYFAPPSFRSDIGTPSGNGTRFHKMNYSNSIPFKE